MASLRTQPLTTAESSADNPNCGWVAQFHSADTVTSTPASERKVRGMNDDEMESRFRRLTDEQRAALRADPHGPVPRELIPRLEQLGLLPADDSHPAGERTLPPTVAEFVATRAD